MKPQWDLGQPPRVVNSRLPDFAAGNYETVRLMRGIARQYAGDPIVRQLALNILNSRKVKSHNFADECRVLGEWVQNNIRYVKDPNGIEQLHNPIYMIEKAKKGIANGDCDDQALLLATLLLSVGHQPYFAIVKYGKDMGAFNHIYTVVYEKNWKGYKQRLVLDTIIPDRGMGFEVPYTAIEEIPV